MDQFEGVAILFSKMGVELCEDGKPLIKGYAAIFACHPYECLFHSRC